MSTDFSIKPVGAPAVTPVAPSVGHATDQAVTTELPPSQTVTAANASTRTWIDSDQASASVSHQIVIDRAAASIVYQMVDERTSLVVEQFPDEAILRRRAYFHALDLTRDEPARTLATDRKA